MTSRKYNHLKLLRSFRQTLHQVGSQVDASAHGLLTREVNLQDDIRILSFDVIYTVDQRLIHVKN